MWFGEKYCLSLSRTYHASVCMCVYICIYFYIMYVCMYYRKSLLYRQANRASICVAPEIARSTQCSRAACDPAVAGELRWPLPGIRPRWLTAWGRLAELRVWPGINPGSSLPLLMVKTLLFISLIRLRSLHEEGKNCLLRWDKRSYFIFPELGWD